MADNSTIEWCDATWNPITGCSRVSRGCEHCYAETLAAGRLRHHPSRAGLTDEHGRWNGVRYGSTEQWLNQPLRVEEAAPRFRGGAWRPLPRECPNRVDRQGFRGDGDEPAARFSGAHEAPGADAPVPQ